MAASAEPRGVVEPDPETQELLERAFARVTDAGEWRVELLGRDGRLQKVYLHQERIPPAQLARLRR